MATRDATLLERLFPRYEFREIHSRRIAATPMAVDRALREFTLAEAPIGRALMILRSLPVLLGGPRPAHDAELPFLAQITGATRVLLADEPGRERVVGLAGPMWRLRGRLVHFADAAAFHAFSDSGHVKAAINFLMQADGDATILTTETRVLAMDPDSRRRFERYWLVIRPWSGLIRREWLRVVAHRAEDETPTVEAQAAAVRR